MRSLFPRPVLKGFVIASLAIPASSFLALTASPVAAHQIVLEDAKKPSLAKRSNGGRTETAAPAPTTNRDRKTGSMGRVRNTAPADAAASEVVADADAPIVLEFAREVTSSTRLRGTDGLSRSDLVIADEIADFDFAATTPEAMDAAEPGTLAAKLAQYRTQRIALFRAAEHQMNAYDNYAHLKGLDSATIAGSYADGAYEVELEKARETYVTLRDAVDRRQADTKATLLSISGGQALSVPAIRALNGLLGV